MSPKQPTSVALRLPGRRRRLRDEIFPWLCDGSGKNLLKSDTHTRCLVITSLHKQEYLSFPEVGDVIGLGLGAKRIRQSESHFGMFDPLGVKSQLLSSVAFLLIILQATPTASSLISGQLASCNVENEVIDLPILAGNPCYVCRCKNKSVECAREECPKIESCAGVIRKLDNQCCSVCHINGASTSCSYKGRTYQHNESWFERDCQTCQCRNGTAKCEDQRCKSTQSLKCPEGKKPGQIPGSCCPQCLEETGVCTSYGDPHYQTFDGQMFNFHGTCRYQLTSDCANNEFTVRMRNERRYSNVYAWSKALTIHLGDSVIVLHKDLQVKVNKSDVDLPYYHLPHFQIVKGSFMVSLISKIGVQVQWDGNGFIEIQVPKRFMGKACGLCGNFNGDSADDFMVKNGRIASSAQEFGEGWSLGRRSHGCEKPPAQPMDSTVSTCTGRLRVYWRAHKRCWPIKKQFANCHKRVKPNAFFWSCISDVCQCSGRRCECEALMAYARACRRLGVSVTWGRKNTCGVSCKGGAVFDDCVPTCQRTCENKDDVSVPCSSRSCVAGCRCPAGTVWNNQKTKCIQSWKCPAQLSQIQGRLRIAAISLKNHQSLIPQKRDKAQDS